MDTSDFDRRAFLSTLGKSACGACLAYGMGGVLSSSALGGMRPQLSREIDYYEKLPGRKTKCLVCPLHCTLADGETCMCRTRTNIGGKLLTRAYDNPCIIAADPIEKMPLSHFLPGSKTLTLGVGGCNLRCLYCQNWQQSQKQPEQLKTFEMTAQDVVAAARKRRIDTIAFSYTEPIAFLEYAKDVAMAAKKAKLNVVVATAAYVDPEPLLDFAQYVDAFAISLKGFDEEFYQRALGVSLAPVLTAIETLKAETKCWIELVNLVVPTYNDDPGQTRQMAEWIHAKLGDDVPLHFARFVPTYRLKNLPRTPVSMLEQACTTAREAGLRYVYTSNIAPHKGGNTSCHRCGAYVIQRLGFKVLENRLKRGSCPECRKRLPGVWT